MINEKKDTTKHTLERKKKSLPDLRAHVSAISSQPVLQDKQGLNIFSLHDSFYLSNFESPVCPLVITHQIITLHNLFIHVSIV